MTKVAEEKDGRLAASGDRATDASHGADKSSPPSGSVSTGARFTPGPWIVRALDGAFGIDGDGFSIVHLNAKGYVTAAGIHGRDDAETAANASLIGAAPELLAALEAALPRLAHPHRCWRVRPTTEWAEHGSASFENCDCEISVARAAIAKARGEQSAS